MISGIASRAGRAAFSANFRSISYSLRYIYICTHLRYRSWARKANRDARSRADPKRIPGRCLTSFLQPRERRFYERHSDATLNEKRRARGPTLTIGDYGHCLTTRFRRAVLCFDNSRLFFPLEVPPAADARIAWEWLLIWEQDVLAKWWIDKYLCLNLISSQMT